MVCTSTSYVHACRKGFTPYVHNQLGSYLETSEASFLIERVEVERLPDTPSRYTATKLHDPWYDHRMGSPRVVEPGSGSSSGGTTSRKTPRQQQGERKKAGEKEKEKKDPHAGDRKAGSTHLPPYPRVNIDYSEYVNRELSFADVDTLRRDARDKYQSGNREKVRSHKRKCVVCASDEIECIVNWSVNLCMRTFVRSVGRGLQADAR